MAAFNPNIWFQISEDQDGLIKSLQNTNTSFPQIETFDLNNLDSWWQIIPRSVDTVSFRCRTASPFKQLSVCYNPEEPCSSKTQPCLVDTDPNDPAQEWQVSTWSDETYRITNVLNGTGYNLGVHTDGAPYLNPQTAAKPILPGQHWIVSTITGINHLFWSSEVTATFTSVPASATTSTQTQTTSPSSTITTGPSLSSAVSLSATTTTTTTSTSNSTLSPQPSSSSTNLPLILGLTLGLTIPIILLILGLNIYYLHRRQRKYQRHSEDAGAAAASASAAQSPPKDGTPSASPEFSSSRPSQITASTRHQPPMSEIAGTERFEPDGTMVMESGGVMLTEMDGRQKGEGDAYDPMPGLAELGTDGPDSLSRSFSFEQSPHRDGSIRF